MQGKRLDRLLADQFQQLSRRKWHFAIKEGKVNLDGHPVSPDTIAKTGQVIQFEDGLFEVQSLAAMDEEQIKTWSVGITIEEQGLLIVSKPAGLPCHPNKVGDANTLANILSKRFPGFASAGSKALEGGLLNRLDTETSGLVFASTEREGWLFWKKCFHDGLVQKTYIAVLDGVPDQRPDNAGSFKVDWPIAHHAKKHDRAVALRTGNEPSRGVARPAETRWTGIAVRDNQTLVLARTQTAMFHQVRVHAAAMKSPLVGDRIYGNNVDKNGIFLRHALHAWRVELNHDITQEQQSVKRVWEADLPEDFQRSLAWFGVSEASVRERFNLLTHR